MRNTWIVMPGMILGAIGALCMAAALYAEPPAEKTPDSKVDAPASPSKDKDKIDDKDRVSVAVARDRSKVMLDVYVATLDVMHHRYFHGDRAVVPARAMEDVFAEIKWQSKVDARWIAVNLKAMSIDHEPATDFEKRAAREIAAGKTDIETVEGGYYRRAGAIPLTGGCVGCHGGLFNKETAKTPKFAGLVISVPVTAETAAAK